MGIIIYIYNFDSPPHSVLILPLLVIKRFIKEYLTDENYSYFITMYNINILFIRYYNKFCVCVCVFFFSIANYLQFKAYLIYLYPTYFKAIIIL